MNSQEPLNVYIGTGPGMEAACDVLCSSIIANASKNTLKRLKIHLMEAWGEQREWRWWHGQCDPNDPEMWGKGYWVTPFSLFRYAIPHVQNFEGYAVYLDADMIVLGDIGQLWEYREPGKWAIAANTNGDCVAVIDCSCVKDDPHWPPFDKLKGGQADKHDMRRLAGKYFIPKIPATWNSCDLYEPGRTQLLHFTGIKTQPMRPWPDLIEYEEHPDPAAVAVWEDWLKKADEFQWQTSLA